MLLTAEATSYVAIAAAAVGALGLAVGTGAALRLRRVRRAYAGVSGQADAGTLLAHLSDQSLQVAALSTEVTGLRAATAAARADLADAIRHVAVIRFDAFGDMGGRLSFTLALLDDTGDGLVLTSIHGRNDSRSYAKGVKAGGSELALSDEEQQVIGYALRGREG